MARTDNLKNFLTDIANAIRSKKEIDERIPASNFDNEILSIENGGDIKLFETLDEMNDSEGNKEDDLAIIYRSEIQNITEDTEFQVINFPDIVILPTAFTNGIYGMFRSDNGSGNVMLNQNSFRFDMWGSNGMIEVSYVSTDGRTYTRTSMRGDDGDLTNPIDFGNTLKYEADMEPWNDAIGYFMQSGGKYFEGLYKYTLNIDDTTHLNFPMLSSFEVTNNVVKFNGEYTEVINNPRITTLLQMIKREHNYSYANDLIMYLKNGELHVAGYEQNGYLGSVSMLYDKDTGNTYINQSSKVGLNLVDYTLHLDTNTYTSTEIAPVHNENTAPLYIAYIVDSQTMGFRVSINDNDVTYRNIGMTLISTAANKSYYNENIEGLPMTTYKLVNKYLPASNQFNVSNMEDLFPGKIAYGKNGIIKNTNDTPTLTSNSSLMPNVTAIGKYGLTYTGNATMDATATADDILNISNAYIKGIKVTGTIGVERSEGSGKLISSTLYDNITMDDINLEYKIGVKASSSSCVIYKLDETNTPVNKTNFSSNTMYSGTAKISQLPMVIAGQTYLRIYVAIKNSSNVVGIASGLVNVNTFEITSISTCSCSSASWNSGTSNYTPQLVVIPTTSNMCIMAYYKISSSDAWTHFAKFTFSNTSVLSTSGTCTVLGWVGRNSSSTAKGLGVTTMQFSPNGQYFLGFSYMNRYWGDITGCLIMSTANNWSSQTAVLTEYTGKDNSDIYKLLSDNYFVKGTKFYRFSNPTTAMSVSVPFSITKDTVIITLGKSLYYMASPTATTVDIYTIEDTTITKVSSITTSNKHYLHHTSDYLYKNSSGSNITGYRFTEGPIIRLTRNDTVYRDTSDGYVSSSKEILTGRTVYTSTGKITGTMANNGDIEITPDIDQQFLPQGYINSGVVMGISDTIIYKNALNLANQILGGAE